jgi:hypothetical protein
MDQNIFPNHKARRHLDDAPFSAVDAGAIDLTVSSTATAEAVRLGARGRLPAEGGEERLRPLRAEVPGPGEGRLIGSGEVYERFRDESQH